jgi:hypothetical protein
LIENSDIISQNPLAKITAEIIADTGLSQFQNDALPLCAFSVRRGRAVPLTKFCDKSTKVHKIITIALKRPTFFSTAV